MMLTCGLTYTDPRAETFAKVLREDGGFPMTGGCGRPLDLTNNLQQAATFRCIDCGRWLCEPCIRKHLNLGAESMGSKTTHYDASTHLHR